MTRQVGQQAKGRKAGTKVVEGNFYADVAEALQDENSQFQIFDKNTFRDFEHQRKVVVRVAFYLALKKLKETLGEELLHGNIDGQTEGPICRQTSSISVMARKVINLPSSFTKPMLFGNRDEVTGRYITQFVVMPAHQSLDADCVAGTTVDLGLVNHGQLIALDGAA